MNKGHGRIEKRTVSISQSLEGIPAFPELKTLIRVQSERQLYHVLGFQNMAQVQRLAS